MSARIVGEGRYLSWYCPGCKDRHTVPIRGAHAWGFNGNYESPTLEPSVLCKCGEYICHCFIKNGTIEFLTDCTHEFNGKTVPIPEIPEDGQPGLKEAVRT